MIENTDLGDLQDDVNAYLDTLPPVTEEWDYEVTTAIMWHPRNGNPKETFICSVTVRQIIDV